MAELIQLELGLNKAQARFTEAVRKRSEFSKESLEFEKDNDQNSKSAPVDKSRRKEQEEKKIVMSHDDSRECAWQSGTSSAKEEMTKVTFRQGVAEMKGKVGASSPLRPRS